MNIQIMLETIVFLGIAIYSASAASLLEDFGSNFDAAFSDITEDATRLLTDGTQCVKDLTKNSLQIEKRFTAAQLGALCGKRLSWLQDSANRFNLLMNDPGKKLTRNQRSWLFQVQDCSDISACICPGGKCPGADLLDDALKNVDSITETFSGNSLDSINKQISGLKNSFGNILGDQNNKNNRNRNKAQNRRNNANKNGQKNNKRGKRQVNALPGKAIRQEYRMMSDEERIRLQLAMNKLKSDNVDGLSKYDLLVLYHTPTQSPGAHWGAAFLPWHRELLKQLEVSLRAYDPLVAFPYWDSSLDSGLPDPTDSILWSDKFLGDGNGYVTTGPFASWTTQHKVLDQARIVRYIGQSQFGSLYKPEDFSLIAQKERFADLTSCVDPYFELLHGTVHMWVGGHMADMPISSNDPSFFMHHSFVDYIWEDWRMRKQTRALRETQYVEDRQACSQYHYANASMIPFPIKNTDGLSNKYTDIFYNYKPRPFCRVNSKMNCDSPYLFCDTRQPRCLSKIVPGGNCTGFEFTDICYQGRCSGGVCVAGLPISATTQVPRNTAFSRPNPATARLREQQTTPVPTTPRRTRRPPATTQAPTTPSWTRRPPETTAIPTSLRRTRQPRPWTTEATQTFEDYDETRDTVAEGLDSDETETPVVCPTRKMVECPVVKLVKCPVVKPVQCPEVKPVECPEPVVCPKQTPVVCPEANHFRTRLLEKEGEGIRTILRPMDKGTENCKCECSAIKEAEEERQETVTKIISFAEKDNNGRNSSVVTRFPNPTFNPNKLKASSEYVWFSITVLEGELHDPIKRSMADKAVVVVKGTNFQRESQQFLTQGFFAEKESYPYYPGAVFIRVPNPKKNKGHTEVSIRVYGLDGSMCKSYCYRGSQGYVPCSDTAFLDQKKSVSDPMPTAKYPIQIPFLQWKGRQVKKKDYHLYLCSRSNLMSVGSKVKTQFSKDDIRRSPPNCRFQRFDDFLLVGFADFWRINLSLDECKQMCRDAQAHNVQCASMMYWAEYGSHESECVLTAQTRKTQPRLFTYDPQERVVYFDYVCDGNNILED